MYQWERPSDLPKPPLRRWNLFYATKWGAGLAVLMGLIKLLPAVGLAIRGASSPATIGDALAAYLSAVLSWAILFFTVAAIRNRLLPKAVREAGRTNLPATERRRRSVLGFVWPPALDAGIPKTAGRLGRVLHWIAALIAWLFLGAIPFIGADAWPYGQVSCMVLAGCAALAGRATRYVLSAE